MKTSLRLKLWILAMRMYYKNLFFCRSAWLKLIFIGNILLAMIVCVRLAINTFAVLGPFALIAPIFGLYLWLVYFPRKIYAIDESERWERICQLKSKY